MFNLGTTTLTRNGARYKGAHAQEECGVQGMKLNIIGVQNLKMAKQNSIPSVCHLIHHWVYVMGARKEQVIFGVRVTLSNVKMTKQGYTTSATVSVADVDGLGE